METKFTEQETALIFQILKSQQVSPLAPDAIGVCQMFQNIMAKIQSLTEVKDNELAGTERRDNSLDSNHNQRNIDRKAEIS